MNSPTHIKLAVGLILALATAAAAQDVAPVPAPEVAMPPVAVGPVVTAPVAQTGCGCTDHHQHAHVGHTTDCAGGHSVEGCLGGREITQYEAEQLWNGYCEGDCRVGTAKPCKWHGLGCRCRHCAASHGGAGFGYGNCGGCGGASCQGCGLGRLHSGCGLHHRRACNDCGCDSGCEEKPASSDCCPPTGCGLLHGFGLGHGHGHHAWGWRASENQWDDMCGRDYWSGSGTATTPEPAPNGETK